MSEKKLGRNDPCWCGSQKKYKHCHMEFVKNWTTSAERVIPYRPMR